MPALLQSNVPWRVTVGKHSGGSHGRRWPPLESGLGLESQLHYPGLHNYWQVIQSPSLPSLSLPRQWEEWCISQRTAYDVRNNVYTALAIYTIYTIYTGPAYNSCLISGTQNSLLSLLLWWVYECEVHEDLGILDCEFLEASSMSPGSY